MLNFTNLHVLEKMIQKLSYLKYYTKVLLNNWTVNKDSYAQHGEDKLIELLLPEGVNTFIDIGANDGVLFSNSYKFAKKGAIGLCVEPSRNSFRKLRLNHLFHPKIKCIQGAISDTAGDLFLHDHGYESTLSSVSKIKFGKSYKVACYTFDQILDKFTDFMKVDLLSVDVEGHEEEVFKGLTNKNFMAKIIILESDKTETEELLSLHSLRAYRPLCSNGINTVLVHKNENIPVSFDSPKGFKRY